jgi:hypothetical protein
MHSSILRRIIITAFTGLTEATKIGINHAALTNNPRNVFQPPHKTGFQAFEEIGIVASRKRFAWTCIVNCPMSAKRIRPRIATVYQPLAFARDYRRGYLNVCKRLGRCFGMAQSTLWSNSSSSDGVKGLSATIAEDTKKDSDVGKIHVPLFQKKRKPRAKDNAVDVLYQTRLGGIKQSSLIGADRYNESDSPEDSSDPSAGYRYRARVLYDGSNYNGWQLQPAQPSVQGLLEAVLSFKLRRSLRVIGAGRTDTGVHARGQAIHFDVPEEIADVPRFEHGVNMILPTDVRVADMQLTTGLVYVDVVRSYKRWHAIYSAKGKLYSYRVCFGPTPDPLQRLVRSLPAAAADLLRGRRGGVGRAVTREGAALARGAGKWDGEAGAGNGRWSVRAVVGAGRGGGGGG